MGVSCLALLVSSVAPAQDAPAVLFAGAGHHRCSFGVARRLNEAGYVVNQIHHPGLDDQPLTWDEAKKHNVIVVTRIGMANADLTLPDHVQESIATLQRFLEEGGGILWMGTFGQNATRKPPQDAFLNPLGLTPLFAEMPSDPETEAVGTAWKIAFAHTDQVADSPITEGVTSLWYPVPKKRVGAQNHTISFTADESWGIIARGSRSSYTRVGELQQNSPTQLGTHAGDVPIMAAREVGKGRIIYLGITPEYLTGPNAETTLEGIVLERGMRQTPSHGLKLLGNALAWLAEPSRGTELGGATMGSALLDDPHQTKFGDPFPWPAEVTFPSVEPAYPGVIGPRTARSSGSGTVDEWVAAAKEAGLAYLVFLEDFRELSAEEFDGLKADCARLTTPEFTAVPGFVIDDEVGNHYLYFGTTFPYPPAKFLSEDGKVFRSHDPELNAAEAYIPGQLSMTTLNYAYSLSSFKLTAGNYLFSQDAAPFANFFCNWDATGVVTSRDGELIEDATEEYLQLVDFGNGPLPLAIEHIDSPGELGQAKWRTVLRMPKEGAGVIGGTLREETKIAGYWNMWHFYPDNPSKIFISSGPSIDSWCYFGPRDYEGNQRGDFVWQGLRWVLRGRVSSGVGLAEVAVYDGEELFRRYLPGGANEYEFTLDLTHDKQHNLVVIATDTAGDRAIGGEQWDRNHRLEEFMCADRNNQLSYGYQTRADGTGVLLGGNQTLATPNKRLAPAISPAATFKNDDLLGAPAFDGAAGGEPDMIEQVLTQADGREIMAPNVSESKRLLHTSDVHIGESIREHTFADGIAAHNVWHTLWRTEPATDFTLRRRSHAFQADPDSPLAVFLWDFEVTLLRDIAGDGFRLACLRPGESELWAARTSEGEVLSGVWEETQLSTWRQVERPFGLGAYGAYLESKLGGVAMYSLTEGLELKMRLPMRGHLYANMPPGAAPSKAGETGTASLLFVGIPRATEYTKHLPISSTEVVERFHRDFGLDDGEPEYSCEAEAGSVTGQRHILDIDGSEEQCFSGKLTGELISSLSIRVGGLNDRWSAYLLDRGQGKARPVGVFESQAWATVPMWGEADLFIGHPIVADNKSVHIQCTQSGEATWTLEVHNPLDEPVRVTVTNNRRFDLLQSSAFSQETLDIPAGSSEFRTL